MQNSAIIWLLLAGRKGLGEETGRRGWLHTDLDRWLWDGKERRAADSREIIERNAQVFQQHGEI